MRTVDQMLRDDAASVERAVLESRQMVSGAVRDSRQAIADCHRRLREAQKKANLILLYGACPVCSTPFTSDVAVCAACPPRLVSEGPTREGSAAWAAREACFAEGDE
jgi:hypothetical protein